MTTSISSWSGSDARKVRRVPQEQAYQAYPSRHHQAWIDDESMMEESLVFQMLYTLQPPILYGRQPSSWVSSSSSVGLVPKAIDCEATSASETNVIDVADIEEDVAPAVWVAVDKLSDLGYMLRGKVEDARSTVHFIANHPIVAEVLLDARAIAALHDIFPQPSTYILRVQQDPDIDDEQLILTITMQRDRSRPMEGVRRLKELERRGVLDADERSKGKITVILGSLPESL